MLDDQAAPFGYIIFCLVIGVFLIVIPWHSLWDANLLLIYVPPLRHVILNNFFRGAVSGLGAIDVAFGMAALGRLIRSFVLFRSARADRTGADPAAGDQSCKPVRHAYRNPSGMIRCYVTNRHTGDLDASVARAIADGVDMIQIREKDLSPRDLLDLAIRVRASAAGSSTKVLVNGRMDIAMAADLDGVHLPSDGLPPARVRPYVRTLGVSTHTREEAVRAEQSGADFIIFGPVFDTPGKTSVGITALRDVSAAVRIPVLAIGGITLANAPEALAAGAKGIAAIRLFQRS